MCYLFDLDAELLGDCDGNELLREVLDAVDIDVQLLWGHVVTLHRCNAVMHKACLAGTIRTMDEDVAPTRQKRLELKDFISLGLPSVFHLISELLLLFELLSLPLLNQLSLFLLLLQLQCLTFSAILFFTSLFCLLCSNLLVCPIVCIVFIDFSVTNLSLACFVLSFNLILVRVEMLAFAVWL